MFLPGFDDIEDNKPKPMFITDFNDISKYDFFYNNQAYIIEDPEIFRQRMVIIRQRLGQTLCNEFIKIN